MKRFLLVLLVIFGLTLPNITFASAKLLLSPGFQEVPIEDENPIYVEVKLKNPDIEYLVRGNISISVWPKEMLESYEIVLPLGTSRYKRQKVEELTGRDGGEYIKITEAINFNRKINHDQTKKIFYIKITPKKAGKIYVGHGQGTAFGFSNVAEDLGDDFLVMVEPPFGVHETDKVLIDVLPKKELMVIDPPKVDTGAKFIGILKNLTKPEEKEELSLAPSERFIPDNILTLIEETEDPTTQDDLPENTGEELPTPEITTTDTNTESETTSINEENIDDKEAVTEDVEEEKENVEKTEETKKADESIFDNKYLPWILLGFVTSAMFGAMVFRKK